MGLTHIANVSHVGYRYVIAWRHHVWGYRVLRLYRMVVSVDGSMHSAIISHVSNMLYRDVIAWSHRFYGQRVLRLYRMVV